MALIGRETPWGRNPAIPLSSVLYVDDAVINEIGPIASPVERKGKNFVEMKNVEWKPSDDALPSLSRVAPMTPLAFDRAYLDLPAFSDLPRGGARPELDGLWKIKKYYGLKNAETTDPGLDADFWKKDCPDKDWGRRFVPSGWYSDDTPEASWNSGKIRSEISEIEKDRPYPWVGWYRREFDVPAVAKNQRAILRFERVSYKCRVWVNGKEIGRHTGGRTSFLFDVTEAIKPEGKNVLAVRVYDPVRVYDWPHWAIGGIWDRVFIDIVPEIFPRRTLIAPNLEKSTIGADVWIDNATGESRTVAMAAIVEASPTPLAQGAEYRKKTDLGEVSLQPGVNKRHFDIPLDKPVYWTPENPFLYTLELQVGDAFVSRERATVSR